MLELFSLKDGRRLGALATVRSGPGVAVGNPHPDRPGGIWLTSSTGPRCTSGISGCGPAPNSCSGTAVRFDPVAHRFAPELTFARSMLVTNSVPSPRGWRVVMSVGGCATSFFDQHLVVRDLRSGRQWAIGADAAPCHALGDPAWSADGAELVFPYGPSVLSPHTHVSGGTCRAPRIIRLAVVFAGRSSRTTTWKLIQAEHGCSYQTATFDRWGIAATEGCGQGEPRGQYSIGIAVVAAALFSAFIAYITNGLLSTGDAGRHETPLLIWQLIVALVGLVPAGLFVWALSRRSDRKALLRS